MILRIFDTDFQTYKHDELLFIGTPEECEEYLRDNWSVDRFYDNESLQDSGIYDLRSIQYCNVDTKNSLEWEQENLYRINPTWRSIDISKFIFNECLIEIL